MTHPLTDEMIQGIWDKVGNDTVDAKDEELGGGFVEDDLMRTAYDLGESKGRADMLERVIEWLNATIFEDNMFFEDSMLSSDIDCLPRRLREAMCPQEDTP